MRIDQWLWAIRVYRSRSLAAEAIRDGAVRANGRTVKPAHEVTPGETIQAMVGPLQRTLVVRGVPPSRVGAARVPEFAAELTTPEDHEYAARERALPSAFNVEKGH